MQINVWEELLFSLLSFRITGFSCHSFSGPESPTAHLALDLDPAPVLKGVAKRQKVARCLAHLDAAWWGGGAEC